MYNCTVNNLSTLILSITRLELDFYLYRWKASKSTATSIDDFFKNFNDFSLNQLQIYLIGYFTGTDMLLALQVKCKCRSIQKESKINSKIYTRPV